MTNIASPLHRMISVIIFLLLNSLLHSSSIESITYNKVDLGFIQSKRMYILQIMIFELIRGSL